MIRSVIFLVIVLFSTNSLANQPMVLLPENYSINIGDSFELGIINAIKIDGENVSTIVFSEIESPTKKLVDETVNYFIDEDGYVLQENGDCEGLTTLRKGQSNFISEFVAFYWYGDSMLNATAIMSESDFRVVIDGLCR